MSYSEQLVEIATELPIEAKETVADLERKLSAIETAKIEIEARLRTGKHALGRLSGFVSIRRSDLQCPHCWINNETTASLGPDARIAHKFRCNKCESDFDLSSEGKEAEGLTSQPR
jgi:hypothetical protein